MLYDFSGLIIRIYSLARRLLQYVILTKKTLEQRLNAYPVIKQRIKSLLNLVENIDGDAEKANDALHCWADRQHEKQVNAALGTGEKLKKKPLKN